MIIFVFAQKNATHCIGKQNKIKLQIMVEQVARSNYGYRQVNSQIRKSVELKV